MAFLSLGKLVLQHAGPVLSKITDAFSSPNNLNIRHVSQLGGSFQSGLKLISLYIIVKLCVMP